MFKRMKIKTKLIFGSLPALLLMVLLAAEALWSMDSIVNSAQWVSHTHKVIGKGNEILASAVDMETGMRGYLLSGRESFLEPYKSGGEAAFQQIEDLKETVNDNPGQVARLDRAAAVLRGWQSEVADSNIVLRREIGNAQTMNDMADLVSEERGKQFFDKFREQVALFVGRERKLLSERMESSAAAEASLRQGLEVIGNATDWVNHTHEVLEVVNGLVAHAVDMETGMRGFLLGGQDTFLEPYVSGNKGFFEGIRALQIKVSDNPAQVARLERAENILSEWIDLVVEPMIDMRRNVGTGVITFEELVRQVQKKEGKTYFDSFRVAMAEFVKAEKELLGIRSNEQVDSMRLVQSNFDEIIAAHKWVDHTYKVIGDATAVLADAVDIETGMRGFLLAGRKNFLEPYDRGRKGFAAKTEELATTVSDNPVQVSLINDMVKTIDDWQTNVTEPAIALRVEIGDAATMDDISDLVAEARGKKFFDEFREILSAFTAEEAELLKLREEEKRATQSESSMLILAAGTGAILVAIVIAWFTGRNIAKPIEEMTSAMKKLADGDLSAEIPAKDREDEAGEMAQTLEVFKHSMIEQESLKEREIEEMQRSEIRAKKLANLIDNFEGAIVEVTEALSKSSTELGHTAESVSSAATETDHQSSAVSDSAQKASANVQTVSAAAEELRASIHEIARQVSETAKISKQTEETVREAEQKISSLEEKAKEIGDVTALINDIAEQTNLLALNATIESARAGEAGKGFAVVANEVKALAAATGDATDKINIQISTMQNETKATADAVAEISAVVARVNEYTASISAAIEQQSTATAEITENAAQASTATSEVAGNIKGVSQVSKQTGSASSELLNVAGQLDTRSGNIKSSVDRFLAEVKSV